MFLNFAGRHKMFHVFFTLAGPYLVDFVSPGGTKEQVLEAKCDHILAKPDGDATLAEVKAAAQAIKDSLP